jgi:type I restriction enzyme S subunit
MSKNNKNKLVPRLRFPEFQNAGEWEVKKLGEVANFLKGKGISKSDINNNGTQPCIRYGELYTHYKEVIKEIKSFTNLDGEDLVLSEPNDVIIPSSGETKEDIATASCVKLGGVALGGDLNILRSSLINGEFLAYYLSHGLKKTISKIAQGDTVVHLYAAQLKKLTIRVPKVKEEQKKIASCLSSLDEVIAGERQKLELLQQHKKGLLQQLFPQEGETVPKLRFKEFEDSGEWEVKRVDEYFNVGSSKRVLQKDWKSQGIPFYRTRELVSLSRGELFKSEVFISEELYEKLKNEYGVPKEGDFLVSGVGTLGVCYLVKRNDKFYFKDGNVIWFSILDGVDANYFKYCFLSDNFQNQIFSQVSKSTVGTYTIQNAKKTRFWKPPLMKEQQKIASCLSSLDDLINAQTQKIELLEQHKKGLVQGLFPMENG